MMPTPDLCDSRWASLNNQAKVSCTRPFATVAGSSCVIETWVACYPRRIREPSKEPLGAHPMVSDIFLTLCVSERSPPHPAVCKTLGQCDILSRERPEKIELARKANCDKPTTIICTVSPQCCRDCGTKYLRQALLQQLLTIHAKKVLIGNFYTAAYFKAPCVASIEQGPRHARPNISQ